MDISEEIRNGLVYKIEKHDKSKIEYCIGAEFKLVVSLSVNEVSKGQHEITGVLYKEDYKGQVIEIHNPILMGIDSFNDSIAINPDGGVLDVLIRTSSLDSIKKIMFKEKNVSNITGLVRISGGEIING